MRQAVLLGLFAGTGVGLGFALAGVPGVELMSLNAALAGAALGWAHGAAAGVLAVVIYSLGSPFGPPLPLVLGAQALGMAVCGALGAFAAPLLRRSAPLLAAGVAAAAGLVAALALDVLTNLAVAISLGFPPLGTLVLGLPVAALHAGTTAAAFGLLLPPLNRRLAGLLRRGPRALHLGAAALLAAAIAAAPAQAQPAPGGEPATAGTDTVAAPRAADVFAAPPDSLPQPLAGRPAPADADSLGLAFADSLHPAGLDSAATRPTDASESGLLRGRPASRLVNQWRRPLWQPVHASLREDLRRNTGWLPVIDGGLGAAVVYFGEPGTTSAPHWTREGLPLAVGHRFLDDPEAIVKSGRWVRAESYGLAGDGSLGGTVALEPLDPAADRDLLDTRWYKGARDTYLRDAHFLTAVAPWRLGFAFGELLDNEGWDFRTPGETRYGELAEPDPQQRSILWGEARARSGRGWVARDLGAAGAVAFSLEQVRKLKLGLPAYGIQHQDLWQNRATLDWRSGPRARAARVAMWWVDADADWDRQRASYRKQEGSNTGVLAGWGEPATGRIEATWRAWSLVDSGADSAWARADTSGGRWRGEQADLRGSRVWTLGRYQLAMTAGGWWDEHGGWLGGGRVGLSEARTQPRWSLALEHGGRAPRSDELATAWRFVVPGGRQTVVLPNPALGREDEWRLVGEASRGVAGFDLALTGALRRLRDGIGWRPLADDAFAGRWENGLVLDSATVRASLAREGRLLGWLRLRADAAWRSWRQKDELRFAAPPAWDWRVAVLWEQHFFQEDGILQCGWFLHSRGELDDPWFLAEPIGLPAMTALDMIIDFRLVGTNLGIEVLNLAGGGSRLTAGAIDHERELRWRLHWVFHY